METENSQPAVVEPVQEKEAVPAENVQETKTTTTKEDDNMGYVSRIFDTPLGYGVCSSKQENKLIIRVPLHTGSFDDNRIVTCTLDADTATSVNLLNPPDDLRLLQADLFLELASGLQNTQYVQEALALNQAAVRVINYSSLKPDYQEEGQVLIIAALTNVCKLYLALGDYEQVYQHANTLCRLRPEYMMGAIYKTLALVSLNRVDEAISFMQAMIKAYPEEQRYVELLKQILNTKKSLEEANKTTAGETAPAEQAEQPKSAFNHLFSEQEKKEESPKQEEESAGPSTSSIIISSLIMVGLGVMIYFMRNRKH